jgi:uncharacterized RDD family membrane protein YckC
MQACSCGVAHDDNSNTCPLSRSQSMIQDAVPNSSIEDSINGEPVGQITGETHEMLAGEAAEAETLQVEASRQASTLIEFPGATPPVPEWRKQLSQRVREVQDRKAREAAEEAAAAREAGTVSCSLPSAQLELVPDLEQPSMNPIVSKVLERLERARRIDDVATGFTAAATAPAFAPMTDALLEPEPSEPKPPETKHKLTVVAPAKVTTEVTAEVTTEATAEATPELTAELTAEPIARKPVRVISDSIDDVALSYLESYLSLPAIDLPGRSDHAGLVRRTIAGFLDLLLVGLMASPAAAVIEFTGGNWSDPRVIGLMGGIAVVTMLAYHIISIALTGRTLAMRMLSLRTIDIRTGLIPTGGQSIKRAFGYIFSLIPLGLGLTFAFIDPDGRTIHDRFSKTLVVRN